MNEVLLKIAQRNVKRLKETGKSDFELINQFTSMYDKMNGGNDKLLVELMANEIGYEKNSCGGWSKK